MQICSIIGGLSVWGRLGGILQDPAAHFSIIRSETGVCACLL